MNTSGKLKPMHWVIIGVGVLVLYKLSPYFGLYKGPLLMIAAVAAIIWLHKRNFDRTNQYGAEVYPTFGHLLRHRTIEGVVSLAAWIAAIVGFVMTVLLFGGIRI